MFEFLQNGKWKRRLSQILSLVVLGEWSFYGIFRCPFAVPYIGCGNCPVVQCPGRSLWMWGWIGIAISALIFGRAFCGWACPGGMVAELLTDISIIRIRIHDALVRVAGNGKYIMLGLSLYFFFVLNNPRWAIPIITGEFFNSIVLTFEHANNLWLYKSIIFMIVFFLGGLVIPRIWCRFLCPTGGLLELINRIALVKIVAEGNCTDCEACRKTCSMDTRPAAVNCTNCGACLSQCPTGIIKRVKNRFSGLPTPLGSNSLLSRLKNNS